MNVQLEANSNAGDQIDESYLIVKGAFGEINLGSENSAMYKMHYAPAEFGITMNSGDQSSWVATIANSAGASISKGGHFRTPLGSTYVEPLAQNDSEKLTYYTPRIEGFQLGISYAPETGQDNTAQPNRDTSNTDTVMAGLNFNKTFGSTNVKASLGYGTVLDGIAGTNTEASAFNAGFGLGFGGLGFGISYASFDDSGAVDGSGVNVGISYSPARGASASATTMARKTARLWPALPQTIPKLTRLCSQRSMRWVRHHRCWYYRSHEVSVG